MFRILIGNTLEIVNIFAAIPRHLKLNIFKTLKYYVDRAYNLKSVNNNE